jgi:hypothetical protein
MYQNNILKMQFYVTLFNTYKITNRTLKGVAD